jgi:hypothetical protein
MVRKVKYIIRGRAHTPTSREYTIYIREKRISEIINYKKNRSNLLFLIGVAYNIKL